MNDAIVALYSVLFVVAVVLALLLGMGLPPRVHRVEGIIIYLALAIIFIARAYLVQQNEQVRTAIWIARSGWTVILAVALLILGRHIYQLWRG